MSAIAALVITVSNRAAAGVYSDTSGPVLAELLREAGCERVDGPVVVGDGPPVRAALRDGIAAGYDVIVTTGGTGISPTDATPQITREFLAYEVSGIAEAIRLAGRDAVPAAVLSRGVAGVAVTDTARVLVVNLPGSRGGVRDGMAVLGPILGHAVDQLRGGDHPRSAS